MHSPVTAIRAGRPQPRFAPPQQRHRERQLGLARRSRIEAALSPARSVAHPRSAIRSAARSLVRPPVRAEHGARALRRTSPVRWIRRNVDGLRAAREGSAAAWRA